MNTLPATNFISRPPVQEDAQGIFEMICASDTALVGAPDIDPDYVVDDWRRPGFSLSDDARIVTTADGQIIGYETVFAVRKNGHIETDGYVHPEFLNQGVGTYLLRWAESRARERFSEVPAEVEICLQVGTYGHDAEAHLLLESEGFHVVRHFWRMEIDLAAPPPEPELPEEVTIRSFVLDQDEYGTWDTVTTAFADHWGSAPRSFADWSRIVFGDPDFDPSLCFLAIADEQIVGIALCNYRMETGWLQTVGVRREWRRLGIATALLNHAFAEFYQRGRRTIGLGVDSQSLTGATQVYERAGMYITQVYDTFQKTIRPGQRAQSTG